MPRSGIEHGQHAAVAFLLLLLRSIFNIAMSHLVGELLQVLSNLLRVDLIRANGSLGEERHNARIHLDEAAFDEKALFLSVGGDSQFANPETSYQGRAARQNPD